MILRDILNTKGTSVLTIPPDVTLAEAVRQLVEYNYGSLSSRGAGDRWSALSPNAIFCARA